MFSESQKAFEFVCLQIHFIRSWSESISSDYYSYCSGFQIYSSVMHGNKWKIMLAVWKNIHSAINCFLNSWILYTGIFCTFPTPVYVGTQKISLFLNNWAQIPESKQLHSNKLFVYLIIILYRIYLYIKFRNLKSN
jgi:hypothetical protein